MMRFWIAVSTLIVGLSSQAKAQTCSSVQDDVMVCGQTWTVSGLGSAQADVNTGCVGNDAGGDAVWFFDPPNGQEVVLSLDPANTPGGDPDYSLIVVEGDWCGLTATCLETSDNPNGGNNDPPTNEMVTFVSDGGGYYVVMDGDGSETTNGDLQVGCPTDECSPGQIDQTLTCSSDIVGATTIGADNDISFYFCGEPYDQLNQANGDSIYAFTPQATGSVTFEISGLSNDQDLYVLQNFCDQEACLTAATDRSNNTDTVTFEAEVGNTYYIVVEAFAGGGTYNLSFQDDTGGCVEDCDDGIDNDNNGDIDCDDIACINEPECQDVELCNGVDDDDDSNVDEGYPDFDGDNIANWVEVEECDIYDNDGDLSLIHI